MQLIKAPYVKIYSIIKTQTMSADGSDEVILNAPHATTLSPSLDFEIYVPSSMGFYSLDLW